MGDNFLPDADYYATINTLRDREDALSGENLYPQDRQNTKGLIDSLNSEFFPRGENVPFIKSLTEKLGSG